MPDQMRLFDIRHLYLTPQNTQFPVFLRVKLLLGLFSTLCQARRDGAVLSAKEKRRLQAKITPYKEETTKDASIEYSPKPYHKGGCFCSGGVSGRTDATVLETQLKPFEELHSPDFLVSSSGFISPVPEGATGPVSLYDKKSGKRETGMAFIGGSGGHGFDNKTTSVYVMDANSRQGPRTYYRNITGQKVDPFTGKTIDPTNPLAHMYHTKNG